MSLLVAPVEKALSEGRAALTADAAVVGKLIDMAGDFSVNLLIALIVLAATVIAARWLSALTRRLLLRTRSVRSDPTVVSFAVQTVRVLVYVIGLIAVLQRLGVQTTSIIAVLGAASLAIGLALQGTLSNVAAGVMLLLLRPYRVGDVVDIGGQRGVVRKLDLFTTQLVDGANVRIIAPNARVLSDVILNLSGQKTRRVEVLIGVGYGDDLGQAREALVAAAAAHPKVLADPKPWAGVTNLLDSSVEMSLHAWVKSEDHFQTRADLFQAAKEALDAAGIEIPYPHQVAAPWRGDAGQEN